MEIIRRPVAGTTSALRKVHLQVERGTLAKRRWRACSTDGREFGFDLETPLRNEEAFFEENDRFYVVFQLPEPVLHVTLGNAAEAASVAWMVGNLHLPIEILGDALFTVDDPAARNLFTREGIPFLPTSRVFIPLAVAHAHH